MRAFIAALLAASVLGNRSKPLGGYNYLEGGKNWTTYYANDAHVDAAACTGQKQSPIDLSTAEGKMTEDDDMKLEFSGTMGKVPVSNRDRDTTMMEVNYQVDFLTGQDITAVNFQRTDHSGTMKTFNPIQMHFHTPSEHTVDGKHYDAEFHFVTKNTSGGLSVVGIFFDKSAGTTDNSWVKSFQGGFDDRFNADDATKAQIDMELLLTGYDMSEFWQYEGSLTTPPCSEGVAWNVMKSVQGISQAQLDWLYRFTKGAVKTANGDSTEEQEIEAQYLDYLQSNTANTDDAAGNNRAVQQLNDRVVYFKHDHDHSEGDGASTLMASAATVAALALLNF